MGKLREEYRRHMRLSGYAAKTQRSYERALVELTREYGVSPDTLSNEQIQSFLDKIIRERHLAWSTGNVYFSAYRSFFADMLKRGATQFSLPRRVPSRRRPVVPDRATVRRILEAATNLKHRALLTLVYGSGLRVSEVVRLQPHHIESAPDRMLVRVEQGKGQKDRYTILSVHALEELRAYWRAFHPGEWLFFGLDRSRPMAKGTAQIIFTQACVKAGVKHLHGIHGLRHAFATHLLEEGVPITLIQQCLGHASLSTTSGYLHLGTTAMRKVCSPADRLYGAA